VKSSLAASVIEAIQLRDVAAMGVPPKSTLDTSAQFDDGNLRRQE
jgi:hypothetical protein